MTTSDLDLDPDLTLDPTDIMEEDLRSSSLVPADMRCRILSAPELQVCNVTIGSVAPEGYVIPYFNHVGEALPYYRIKLLKNFTRGKYRQPVGTINHIYFPPNFYECLKQHYDQHEQPYIIITEGEKKAACCVKHGFPCVAFGGVDSWRNRTLILPSDVKIDKMKSSLRIKLLGPVDDRNITEEHTLAEGFTDLLELALGDPPLTLIICYDSDHKCFGEPVATAVQQAASQLGFEFRFNGVALTNIRQLELPSPAVNTKVALDDLLAEKGGAVRLHDLIDNMMLRDNSFPPHPNIEKYINSKLQQANMLSRKDKKQISLAILCALDTRGKRLKDDKTKEPYFFDGRNKHLLHAKIAQRNGDPYHETLFGQFLYREFGLSAGDQIILNWLASQFTGEAPVENVVPLRVCALHPKNPINILQQLNDHQYCMVTPNLKEPLIISDNGTNKVLFEQDQVEPLDVPLFVKHFNDLNSSDPSTPLKSFWESVLENSNMTTAGEKNLSASLFALLCHCSPWLNNWKGTQLPIEILIGEAGSGKALHIDSDVLTPTGFVPLSTITPSTVVTTPYGTAKVTAVHPQGKIQLYTVRTSDDVSVIACADHGWSVNDMYATTREIIDLLDNDIEVELPLPILQGTEQELIHEPHALGAFITLDRQNRHARIPDMYLNAALKQRKAFLHGLLHMHVQVHNGGATQCIVRCGPLRHHTRQSVTFSNATFEYQCHSYTFAHDLGSLVRSLGGVYSLDSKTFLMKAHLPHHILLGASSTPPPRRTITSITPYGVHEAQCITLDDARGLFITDGYVVTHNSSLFELRQLILTGRPILRNMAPDMRDWYASITTTGGMHVTDNVYFTNKEMRQRISDEMCRITTEPDPHIELRKLYTTAQQWRYPVNVIFAMTAIEQPFPNVDLLQRSAIVRMKHTNSIYDGDWVSNQLSRHGGRERWLAHHMVILHKFLYAVVYGGAWDTEYKASHRLAHYEQTLTIMGDIIGIDTSWVGEALMEGLGRVMTEADWTLEGLLRFADTQPVREFGAREIASWAVAEDDFDKNPILTNTRKLGRYMNAHRKQIELTCEIFERGKSANRKIYIAKTRK